jgi:GntR family transcriptional regulator
MSDALETGWALEFNSGIPVYKQIVNRICSALASGAIKEGDQLPTIRSLHQQLDVNPNTVAKAYRELEIRGVISSERGSGSYVRASAAAVQLPPKERRERLESFYRRMLSEAAGCGLTEDEVIEYIKERKKS